MIWFISFLRLPEALLVIRFLQHTKVSHPIPGSGNDNQTNTYEFQTFCTLRDLGFVPVIRLK
jgi:hypothetical protein